MKGLLDEKDMHVAFKVSLALKGAFALVEIIAGLFTFLITPQVALDLVEAVTRSELTEDPRDFVATHMLRAAQSLSVSGQHFAAFYLLSHGIVKLWLVIGLWRGKLLYYPTAVVVFGLFIAYQIYRYSFTHSPLLLVITLLDGVVIWLTWTEYGHLRRIFG